MRRSQLNPASPALIADLRRAVGAVSTDALTVATAAVDASHYLLTPRAVVTASSAADVAMALGVAHRHRVPATFRSGGTSLSGQALSDGLLIDVRARFRDLEILDDGLRVRCQPGLTVREVNAHLARHGRKLGPDPASEIACTIGGVVANNSSGMTCGVTANTYRTLESLVLVLPSGAVVDTADPEAETRLAAEEPHLHAELLALRAEVAADSDLIDDITRRWAIKNTMGYGLNSLVDFADPIAILQHLVVGSEGTLGFIAEATFRTVPVLPAVATDLLVFGSLAEATASLPGLVETGAAVVELLDEQSLAVCRLDPVSSGAVPSEAHRGEAALLIEYQAADQAALAHQVDGAETALAQLSVRTRGGLDSDPSRRGRLWQLRKGLFTKVAGARPAGTTALLEDVAVPVAALAEVSTSLQRLFSSYDYRGSVIFGHAKDGNLHFLINEDFSAAAAEQRYAAFTDDMVELVLQARGTLKAEHGTGRIMAPFVERQYGPVLTDLMWRIKRAFDPAGVLNPDAVLTTDHRLHLTDLKLTPTAHDEVDRCVECGYCEPVCPSQFLTLTPRQRIVAERAIAEAEGAGDLARASELRSQHQYQVIDTCAVDGICQTACPVGINTGDLVRGLRRERSTGIEQLGWQAAARQWGRFSQLASSGLSLTHKVPAPLVRVGSLLGRSFAGADMVPLITPDVPPGGRVRQPRTTPNPTAVYFPACVQTIFGGDDLASQVLALAELAGVELLVPEPIAELCCGTPWKSKGMTRGLQTITSRTVAALVSATGGGRLPVVVDASSCTEGLIAALTSAGVSLEVREVTEFVATTLLPQLPAVAKVGSAVVHPTCSSTHLGSNAALESVAAWVAESVETAPQWRCCGFAGDRGLLHPELTAAATSDEATWIRERSFDLHLSNNRTCELGMARATATPWRHAVSVLAERVTS